LDFGSFQIIESNKSGLNSRESYIVARDGISYLRVLGDEPRWEVMTTTASEDDGSANVCSDRRRLVEAAIRLCQNRGLGGFQTKKDLLGRDYIKLAIIVRDGQGEPLEDLRQLATEFFDLFDASDDSGPGGPDEMVGIYESISSDSRGEDVYLSDGLWLSSDGSLHDRGR
jgi:hypothetical protein